MSFCYHILSGVRPSVKQYGVSVPKLLVSEFCYFTYRITLMSSWFWLKVMLIEKSRWQISKHGIPQRVPRDFPILQCVFGFYVKLKTTTGGHVECLTISVNSSVVPASPPKPLMSAFWNSTHRTLVLSSWSQLKFILIKKKKKQDDHS